MTSLSQWQVNVEHERHLNIYETPSQLLQLQWSWNNSARLQFHRDLIKYLIPETSNNFPSSLLGFACLPLAYSPYRVCFFVSSDAELFMKTFFRRFSLPLFHAISLSLMPLNKPLNMFLVLHFSVFLQRMKMRGIFISKLIIVILSFRIFSFIPATRDPL